MKNYIVLKKLKLIYFKGIIYINITMVKNKIGGSKSKNIGSKIAKKKITAEDPDFENSFFATITTKPNGLMCTVRLCMNEQLKKIMDETDLKQDIQVNIGKLKNDKRNYTLSSGDVVQVELNFDMKRANGNIFGCILCKYDSKEIKDFKKRKLLVLEDDSDVSDSIEISDDTDDEDIKTTKIEYPEVSSDVDLDDL